MPDAIEFQSWSVAYGTELKFIFYYTFFLANACSINGNKRRLTRRKEMKNCDCDKISF